MNRRDNSRKPMRAMVLALGVASIVAGAAAPAFADDAYRDHRAWREHERHEQARRDAWREEHRREAWRERHAYAYDFRYQPRDYYYAPRPVYPAPPYYVR